MSLLDRGLVVFEFGTVDPTVEAYAFRHLPFDMDVAVGDAWKLETRRVGGEGNERWVLSTYRVTGTQRDGTPIDHTTLETVILRRSGDAVPHRALPLVDERPCVPGAGAASSARKASEQIRL